MPGYQSAFDSLERCNLIFSFLTRLVVLSIFWHDCLDSKSNPRQARIAGRSPSPHDTRESRREIVETTGEKGRDRVLNYASSSISNPCFAPLFWSTQLQWYAEGMFAGEWQWNDSRSFSSLRPWRQWIHNGRGVPLLHDPHGGAVLGRGGRWDHCWSGHRWRWTGQAYHSLNLLPRHKLLYLFDDYSKDISNFLEPFIPGNRRTDMYPGWKSIAEESTAAPPSLSLTHTTLKVSHPYHIVSLKVKHFRLTMKSSSRWWQCREECLFILSSLNQVPFPQALYFSLRQRHRVARRIFLFSSLTQLKTTARRKLG